MALSDYLTGEEWDACFYASMGQHHEAGNFGHSMKKTIKALLDAGYKFHGLDEFGEKRRQVENGINASKLMIFLGRPEGIDVLAILDNGRNFLKKNLPSLVDETDEEWSDQMSKAKEA